MKNGSASFLIEHPSPFFLESKEKIPIFSFRM